MAGGWRVRRKGPASNPYDNRSLSRALGHSGHSGDFQWESPQGPDSGSVGTSIRNHAGHAAHRFSFGSRYATGLSLAPRGYKRSAGVGLATSSKAMPSG